ncbi:MAG TPA: carboxypeptidase regulatory-like domain-containing protein [Candidatus Solibacter sp.]|nr:carboxypeptidase regulatory-like domain-containing protein [Candidatus Solibacter sp.]
MIRALLIAALTLAALHPAVAANGNGARTSQAASSAILRGTIRDSAGAPVAEATIVLEEKGSANVLRAKTAADGAFSFAVNHGGSYTVRAEKTGWLATLADPIALEPGNTRQLDLVLTPEKMLQIRSEDAHDAAKNPADGMEFKDEPSFQVAGVTDWSDLGLHGSASTSRTSESLVKETLELKPEDAMASGAPDKRYALAMEYNAKGDFGSAREEVRKQLAASDDSKGHRLLGELNEKLGDPLDAVHEYEKAARMDPSEQNYFEWGTELLLHKAAKQAAEVFARGATVHSNSARLLTGLGAALYTSGSADEAARRLCHAADLQPTNPTTYLFLGKIEVATSGPLPCSEAKLARFANQQPENARANYYYAISVWKRAKTDGDTAGVKAAEALFEKSRMIDPKFGEADLQLGLLHVSAGNRNEAIRDFQRAVEASPLLGEAHRQLGLAYQRNGETAKAQAEFAEYDRISKSEAAETEKEERELRQFVILLNGQPKAAPPQPN